jgi:hypothetical protein
MTATLLGLAGALPASSAPLPGWRCPWMDADRVVRAQQGGRRPEGDRCCPETAIARPSRASLRRAPYDSFPTRLGASSALLLPWAHGHQAQVSATAARRSRGHAPPVRPRGHARGASKKPRSHAEPVCGRMGSVIRGCSLRPGWYRRGISHPRTAKCDEPDGTRAADQPVLGVVGWTVVLSRWTDVPLTPRGDQDGSHAPNGRSAAVRWSVWPRP